MNKLIIIKLTIFLAVILLSIAACSAKSDSTHAQKQNKSHEPEQDEEQEIKRLFIIHRNEDDDLVVSLTAEEVVHNWNVLCKNDRKDAAFPDLSDFETYVMNEAVHSDHPTWPR